MTEPSSRSRLSTLAIVALTAGLVALAVALAWRRDAVLDLAPPAPAAAPAAVASAAAAGPAPAAEPVAREATRCTIHARVVVADGRPLRDCPVQVWLGADTGSPLATASDEVGRLEFDAPIACGRAVVQLDWGPEPLRLERARTDRLPAWDLGDLVAPPWCQAHIGVTVDPDARQHLAVHGFGVISVELAAGVFPNLAAMAAAREAGRVRRVAVALDAGRAALEERAWIPCVDTMQTFTQWQPGRGGPATPLERRLLRAAEPGRFEPLLVHVRATDFVCGQVVWSDGTPAEGIPIEVLADAAKQQQLPPARGRSLQDGRFAVLAPAAAQGRLTAVAGRTRCQQTYAAGADNRVELTLRPEATLRVRVVDGDGRPVDRSGVFQLNRIQRTATGALDRDALRDERATASPGGVHVLAVPRVRRGERWFIVTPAFGEVGHVFEQDVEPGRIVDVPAAGNVAAARTVRVELPVTGVDAGAMLSLKEQSPRGDAGARYWLRCRDAFARGFVEVEHVHPGVYELEVSPAPPLPLQLPLVRVE